MAQKKRKLTGKQKLFVEYYLQNWNATRAAKLAGYSGSYQTLRKMGSENLTKPNILSEIKQRLETVAMTSNEVLARLSAMARAFDIGEYVKEREIWGRTKDGDIYLEGVQIVVDFDKLTEDGYSHLIKKIKTTTKGYEVEWHDQMTALAHLGKYHKLFTDRLEHTGKDGEPLPAAVIYLPDNQRDKPKDGTE